MNDKNMKKFELQLTELINNCGLTVGEAYYIVKNALLELEHLYLRVLAEPDNIETHEETIDIQEATPESTE